MKNILTLGLFCLCIYSSNGQTKIDTVTFQTAVERILTDYSSNFQNIKVVDTCPSFCQLNFFIPGTYYPFCEVSQSYSKELNYTCTITYSNYDFKAENSEKYRDYVDTDSLTMHNFRTELNKVIQKSLESSFGKVTVIEEDCVSQSDDVICTEFIFRTEHINTDREFFQVTMKLTTEKVADGSTYYYTSLRFEKNKW